MMRNFFIPLLLICILLLSSCSLGGGRGMIFDNSDKKADARLEQILDAISNKDKELLKAMFSKQALSEADDFDRNLDTLFQYVQGSIQSWESTGAYGGTDAKNADGTGNRKKEIESTYIFTTSEQEYQIAVYEYTIDTANPDNVGVYSLCIIRTKDNQDSEFVYWGTGKAGINIG